VCSSDLLKKIMMFVCGWVQILRSRKCVGVSFLAYDRFMLHSTLFPFISSKTTETHTLYKMQPFICGNCICYKGHTLRCTTTSAEDILATSYQDEMTTDISEEGLAGGNLINIMAMISIYIRGTPHLLYKFVCLHVYISKQNKSFFFKQPIQ
jgi:hypothetical protein